MKHGLHAFLSDWREFGANEAVCRFVTEAAFGTFPKSFRQRARPKLSDFTAAAGASLYHSADEVADKYFPAGQMGPGLAQMSEEYRAIEAELNLRYQDGPRAYPFNWGLGGASFLLYAMVRSRRPQNILETGVANGESSYVMLSAVRANGVGTLHSIDVRPDVGSLLRNDEKESWRLHLLDRTHLRKSFEALVDKMAPPDLFFHDSDHSYRWQYYELKTMAQRLAPQGIMAADDVGDSYAFLDFCAENKIQPAFLLERNIFGFTMPCLPK